MAKREVFFENFLAIRVAEEGGICHKLEWINRRGAPDRLVVMPGHCPIWVEMKATGAEPELHQAREHARMRALGMRVDVIDSLEGVEELLVELIKQPSRDKVEAADRARKARWVKEDLRRGEIAPVVAAYELARLAKIARNAAAGTKRFGVNLKIQRDNWTPEERAAHNLHAKLTRLPLTPEQKLSAIATRARATAKRKALEAKKAARLLAKALAAAETLG